MAPLENSADAPSPESSLSGTTLWCVAALVVTSKVSPERERGTGGGTKHFKPGAKVYVIDRVAGTDTLWVAIGHHRKSRQFVKSEIETKQLELPHLEEVDAENVIALARKHVAAGGNAPTKEAAEANLQALIAF